jgi:hypothetical protein
MLQVIANFLKIFHQYLQLFVEFEELFLHHQVNIDHVHLDDVVQFHHHHYHHLLLLDQHLNLQVQDDLLNLLLNDLVMVN